VLKVDQVTKCYKDKTVVNHINFEIEKGHICGFVGPNGAGKSTTMNMITGYLQATSGTVSIDGLDIHSQPMEYRRSFGYLPEFPPLYPDMLVEDYLNFVYDAKGLERKERKFQVTEAMEMTEITHVKGRLIKNLSKGYKQRLGMSQAFLGKPSLIILDEPTIGLDPAQIVQVRKIMLSLRKRHTVLLSSHILSEIAEVCDEIVLINHGNLIAAGTEKELIETNSKEKKYRVKVLSEGTNNVAGIAAKVSKDIKVNKVDTNTFECVWDVRKDFGRELLRALTASNVGVMEFYEKTYSLEDIFLKLVNKI
jgi:ABC-2 type transport system ATP-binding protein